MGKAALTTQQAVKAGLFLAVPLGLFALTWLLPVAGWVKAFTDWSEQQGAIAILFFVGGYVVAVLLLFPGALLTIASGMVFGVFWGTVVALGSATLGATLAFLISRYLARSIVKTYVNKHETFRAVDTAIGENDWKVITLLRLTPLVPFNLSNYFYGVTKARLWAYVAATFVGMVPGALIWCSLGHVGMSTLGDKVLDPSASDIAILASGLAATIAATWYLTRLAKKELKAQAEHTATDRGIERAQHLREAGA